MQRLLVSIVVIASLFIYFGCQQPSPTDPTTQLDKKNKGATWYVPGDFATIQDAIDAAADGDIIRVGAGNHFGALVTKSVTIKGEGDAVINDGPPHSSGQNQGFRMLAGSNGSTISHLTFNNVNLAIMNGNAVTDVTITHCTFLSAVQAISNWRGNNWEITHNNIVDLRVRNGGGIGILVADYSGGTVKDNMVSHNKISGTLYVNSFPDINEGGGYDGSGIVLYADFRWGWPGAAEISNNYVTHNSVSLESDDTSLVDVHAFELSEVFYPDPHPGPPYVIYDNSIGFNDFRGTTSQMLFSPAELEDENYVSRNLGENRGHGLHPSYFKP